MNLTIFNLLDQIDSALKINRMAHLQHAILDANFNNQLQIISTYQISEHDT